MVSLPAGQTKPGAADAAGACSSVAPSAPAVIRELRPSLTLLFIGNSSCGGEWLTGSGGPVNRAPEVSVVPRAVLKWTLVLRQTSWTEVVGPVRVRIGRVTVACGLRGGGGPLRGRRSGGLGGEPVEGVTGLAQ